LQSDENIEKNASKPKGNYKETADKIKFNMNDRKVAVNPAYKVMADFFS